MTEKKQTEEKKYCIGCSEVHEHNDGALFCKRRASRVEVGDIKPDGCKSYNLRDEDIPLAMNWNKPRKLRGRR